MLYKLFAEITVILHFGFILFVIFGASLIFKYPRLIWLHLPVAIYGMAISFFRWICPLTPLENHFRLLAGEQGYQGGFITHYLLPVIYPEGMTTGVAISMGLFVLLWNGIFYGLYIFRKHKKYNND